MVFDARDMVERDFPDKLGVITYVSQLYEYFKNKIPGIFNFDTIVICTVMYISENINIIIIVPKQLLISKGLSDLKYTIAKHIVLVFVSL